MIRKGRQYGAAHGGRAPQRGFTYVALLAAIVIIGISMGAAGKYWSHVKKRDSEEELLFRGGQYRQAIERYYLAKAPHTLPQTIEQLLKDDRFPQAKRHLRLQYTDPITGDELEVIRDLTKGNRIVGVFSKSDREPLKKTGFSEANNDFENKNMYSEWKFIFVAPQAQHMPPGQRPFAPSQPFPPGQRSFPATQPRQPGAPMFPPPVPK